jgi:hypothetical protein
MAAVNSLDALFKRVWGDGAIKALPNFAKLQQEVPFSQRERLGDMYVVPVVLQFEHGFSYGAHADGAFTLNAAVAGKILQAQIRGSMIVLRSQLSYEDIFKAAEAGPAAFESATSLVVENMQRSFAKRQELAFWYGQTGLGKVSGITSHVITMTDATWAPGMWSGMKDCVLSSYDGITGTDTAHDAASGSGTVTGIVISSVSMADKQVTVTGDTATVANDHLYFFGSRTATAFKECAGIDKIMTNTGTLFNIDAASYELWKSNSLPVGGPISMLAALNGVSSAQNMGLDDEATLWTPTKRWNSLNSDQAALRRYGAYSQKAENGSEGIVYHSVNGRIDIKAHPFLKEGESFLIVNPKKQVMRVGASDITFRRPGMQTQIFRELVDSAGVELRAFSDQAVMIKLPAQCTKYTGITD